MRNISANSGVLYNATGMFKTENLASGTGFVTGSANAGNVTMVSIDETSVRIGHVTKSPSVSCFAYLSY